MWLYLAVSSLNPTAVLTGYLVVFTLKVMCFANTIFFISFAVCCCVFATITAFHFLHTEYNRILIWPLARFVLLSFSLTAGTDIVAS